MSASSASASAAASSSADAATAGGSQRPTRALYVGGLGDDVTLAMLQAAFIPFGELTDVQLPLDVATGKPRGFGFVQFAEEGDTADALANMHGSEIAGRAVKVSFSKPLKTMSAWADADEWLAKIKAEGLDEEEEEEEAGGGGGGAAAAAAAAAEAGAP